MLSTCGKFKGFIENKPIDLRWGGIIPTLDLAYQSNRRFVKLLNILNKIKTRDFYR